MGTIGGEDSKEKKLRLAERDNGKVYSRKIPNKPRNQLNVLQHSSEQTLATTITDENTSPQPQDINMAASDDSSSLNLVKPGAQDVVDGNRISGYVKFDNLVKINLNSLTKSEARCVKRKLASELDQVRRLMGRFEEVQFNSQYARSNTNQFQKNSDFGLGKEKSMPKDRSKKSKPNERKNRVGGFGQEGFPNELLKRCSNLLGRLMKHKYSWVFNTPVDVKGLKLHDYHTIIKHPMDLGTVKTRLNKKLYKSPRDFAEDVRLTFSNAMTYNSKGQDVHVMAETLSKMFEEGWAPIEAQCNLNRRHEMSRERILPNPNSRGFHEPSPAPSIAPTTPVPPPPPLETRSFERSEFRRVPDDPPSRPTNMAPLGRTPASENPKVKDPIIREMTFEEKQKLSFCLQDLPSDKLDGVVQIIKTRNPALLGQEDEIELDIESLDNETLWELDRFVTNYMKSMSKNNGETELAPQPNDEAYGYVELRNPTPPDTEAPNRVEAIPTSPPAHEERQSNNASGSSSSGSSSSGSGSSSSDSDNDITSV